MLQHVVVHLLLLFFLQVIVLIELTLFVNLLFFFKEEVLFAVVLVELRLLLRGELLAQVVPAGLGQGDDSSLLFSRPLPYLGIIATGFYHLPSSLFYLLPVLYLHPLALLIEVLMQ